MIAIVTAENSSMCPMDGKYNNQNMIYQAKVTTPSSRETYIGLCDRYNL